MYHPDHDRFAALINALPLPASIYSGPDMIITHANTAKLQQWGKDASVIGKRLIDALPELNGQPFLNLLSQVYNSGVAYHADDEKAELVIAGIREAAYYNFTYAPLKNAVGETEAILSTATNVTDLVLARKQMQEAQDGFDFALAAAEIGTWDLDPVTNTITCNARCRELFGFSANKHITLITYEEILNRIHPEDKQMVEKAVMTAIDPAYSKKYDIQYRTISQANERVRWIHCKGKAYFKGQQAYRFAGTVQDITEDVNGHVWEQQLLCLVDNNTDLMSVINTAGELIYVNQSGRKLLGIDLRSDISGVSVKNLYLPEELKRLNQTILPAIHEHTGWQGIIRLRNQQTGEIIPCHVNYMLIKDPQNGKLISIGATARDLRKDIQAKADLLRLATIVDISEDFINYADIEGNTLYLNKAGKALIGMDESRLYNSNLFDYHTPSSSAAIRNQILPQLLSEGSWSGQLELTHQQSGEIIPIHKQLFIIREEITNEPVAIAGIARDLRPEINARKALNDKNIALNEVVKELKFLADSIPSVVWTSTAEGQLDFVNRRWQERSAGKIEQVLGDNWINGVHPDDQARTLAAWHHSLATGDPYEIEFRTADQNGDYRWYLVRALPLKSDTGQIIKWYGTNTDIQEQKELARQKDNFLGVASHELKTPVTSIKAYAQVMEMLFKRSGDTKNAELVAKMDKQLNRLNNLIGDLLDVTKINTGRLQFNYSSFDFSQMIEEITEEVQRTTQKHTIRKKLMFKGEVYGDRERISQVVTNLLTNAIKYSPEANEISLYTEDHGNEIQLCVQDFGIGISQDKKDRVFEQFYRVSGTKEHTFPGLGLGLYISAEIVKHLGGRIWVNSVEGKGSTFCFAIPVNQN